MKLSLSTRIDTSKMHAQNGYGYATECMLNSLHRLGYQISDNDASADVEICFDQPHWWSFQPGMYKIGYHPWESTKLLPGWVDIMNQCDEIWTPSPLIAEWYKADGITAPIFVYEHGVDHAWKPKPRVVEDKIKFLHVGAEATRKGGWDTMRLFRHAFPGRNDVELTLKTINSGWNKISRIGKTNIIDDRYSFAQLQDLFYDHHVYVYPSWGEGFGLTPLQAMATAMPTIVTPSWAPYKRFVNPMLAVRSELAKSAWPEIHPGYMLRPNFDDVIDRMRYAADNYEAVQAEAELVAPLVHSEYDWDKITKEVFESLENRLKSL